jgi:hypothetical protein
MKRIILINGLVAGVIVSAMLLINHPLVERGVLDMDSGMIVGYASMVIALSMIFFGIKTFRDQYNKGSISFGQGFKVGILIAVVAALLYCITWEVYYNVAAGDFLEQYTRYYLEQMKEEGKSEAEINEAKIEMEKFNEQYKNPIIRFGVTLTEILPVGLLITLISAAILRKREVLPSKEML